MDFDFHSKTPLGGYAKVYEKTGYDRTDHPVGAIYLRPTQNLWGGYTFYLLKERKRFEHRQLTPCPMTPDMIEQVLHAKKKGQQCLVFKIKQGQVVEKVAADESTIVDAGDNTTGVNDPPSPK